MKKQSNSFFPLVMVWIMLLILLSITVATSFVPLGPGNFAINALVAIAKAGLVAAFYMQMRHAASVIRVVALIAAVALSLMFLLSGLDYVTRITDPAPWQQTPPSLYVEPPPS